MRKDIVDHYSNHILLPIETFIKQEERKLNQLCDAVTSEQVQILQQANDLFLEKLDTFCSLCDDTYQLEEMLNRNIEKKN